MTRNNNLTIKKEKRQNEDTYIPFTNHFIFIHTLIEIRYTKCILCSLKSQFAYLYSQKESSTDERTFNKLHISRGYEAEWGEKIKLN